MGSYRDFEIRAGERRLLVRGETVAIGARAFDLLLALAQRSDRVVSKHELLDVVWPKLVVEENNLQVQIHALRKLLGPGAITTVPGRGYRFTAEPAAGHLPRPEPARESAAGPSAGLAARRGAGNLPGHVPELYGREEPLQVVHSMVAAERLVTITGASGIGKTRLALAAAHRCRDAYEGGVWMVELASVQDPQQVAAVVAQTTGVQLTGRKPALDELAEGLRHDSALLILDNCEHLVDEVARVASRLMGAAPLVRMLATSQELLRVPEEKVYKLAPLAVPAEDSCADPAAYGAVKLFVERAQALDRSFALDHRNAASVIEICRKLDGIPLAIELAAARVPGLGVYGIQDRLGERFRMLTGGARVTLRRHQTLRAALDWSHNLLGEDERKVFRRLAVFSDGFSVEGAQLVCRDDRLDEWSVLDVLNALVDKSLVLVDASPRPRYRFLESTRAYAMEKLAEAGETNAWLRRHAESMKAICEEAARRRDTEWMWAEMNNVRVAYAWAIQAEGAELLAVALATWSAMVLAVGGLVHEAMQRLLQVEPLVGSATPPELAARFWQWLGRGGMDGRLPTSRCLDALSRAEGMFKALGNERHVHACLRMRAEAMLASEDLAGAAEALKAAESMERARWPVADRMRRLRVQGLLDWAAGRHTESLSRLELALHMAQTADIERYELVLLADLAGVHLETGGFAEAGEQFALLAEKARGERSQGLVLAQALAGLVAALLGQDRLAEAASTSLASLPLLRRCGIFVANSDIYAWLAAQAGHSALAGRLVGAADAFHTRSETAREPIKRVARAKVMDVLQAGVPQRIPLWLSEGAALDEDALAGMLEAGIAQAAMTAPSRQGMPAAPAR